MRAVLRLPVIADKTHRLFQRLETGLPQQDRYTPTRRPLDHGLGIDAGTLHLFLRRIDIQRARREVIDVRAVETDHVGDQLVRLTQRAIGRQRHGGIAVPAEGFQRLGYELPCLVGIQPTLLFVALDQLQDASGKDLSLLQDLLGLCAQRGVFDQLQPQQRGEHAKRVGRQRRLVDRAERGGMHRHAGHRQVVIATGCMPITAKSRRKVASSAAVPTRMAPCRSRSSRARSSLRCSRAASAGSACSVCALTWATNDIRSPYNGTSERYMSDIAWANQLRI